MKMAEIQTKAQSMGLDPRKLKKVELIRNIQTKEGNESCYKTNRASCMQYECCWRDDCKPN